MVLFYNLAFSHLIDTGFVFPSLSLCHFTKVLENVYTSFWAETQTQSSGIGNLAFKFKKAVETGHFTGWKSQVLPLWGTRGISTAHLRNFTDLTPEQYEKITAFHTFLRPRGNFSPAWLQLSSCFLQSWSQPRRELYHQYRSVIASVILLILS